MRRGGKKPVTSDWFLVGSSRAWPFAYGGEQLKKNLIRACEKETTKRKEVPEIRRVIYRQIFIITEGRMERGPFLASSSAHPHSMGRGT
jgi:hypothetical protein